jgi:hypothetical protein
MIYLLRYDVETNEKSKLFRSRDVIEANEVNKEKKSSIHVIIE